MNRYAAAADRARLLYRFPTAPNGGRTLELYHAGKPLLSGGDWPGAAPSYCRIGIELENSGHESAIGTEDGHRFAGIDIARRYAPASFDLVVLHRTLDELASVDASDGKSFEPSVLLKNILTVMAPGGVLAGCVNNRWAINSLMRQIRGPATGGIRAQSPGIFSLRSLRTLLTVSGYSDIRLFTLLPDSSAPFKLIDTDPAISRAAFRHELQIMRRYMRLGPSYFLRRAAVELGLNRHVEQSIFFWAVKTC
jgi:SAM-dependent methyltransferase